MGVFHKADFTCRKAKGVLTICPYSLFILSGGNIALSIFLTSTAFVSKKANYIHYLLSGLIHNFMI